MSSRGQFLGQIIDDLDAIASQVRQRCALGHTDLNRVLEDFFKELLNEVRGSALINLNKTRSNEPGLDLGDATSARKVAFQVTSSADSRKVNDTLRKVTDKQLATYDELFILVIGERQKTYSVDAALAKRCRFDAGQVIGMTELVREIMDADMPTIQAVSRKLADEQRRIRIELEPEVNGRFATSVLDFVEPKPDVTRSDCSALVGHEDCAGLFASAAEAAVALDGFIRELERLPRFTREFFGWLVDNSDECVGFGAAGREINADLVDGRCRGLPSYQAEIRLLTAKGFVDFEQDESWKSGSFRLTLPGARGTNLEDAVMHFLKAEELSASSMFSTMNFSPFGPPPSLAKTTKAKNTTATAENRKTRGRKSLKSRQKGR